MDKYIYEPAPSLRSSPLRQTPSPGTLKSAARVWVRLGPPSKQYGCHAVVWMIFQIEGQSIHACLHACQAKIPMASAILQEIMKLDGLSAIELRNCV